MRNIFIQNLVKVYPFALNILSRNEILTSLKDHNSVSNLRKMPGNNPNLNLLNMNAYIKFGEILLNCSKDIEQKGNSEMKGPTSVTNLQKMAGNNPNLDPVNINAYIKFNEILSICPQDIERKQNSVINQGL